VVQKDFAFDQLISYARGLVKISREAYAAHPSGMDKI
jgi:hypothetical protein